MHNDKVAKDFYTARLRAGDKLVGYPYLHMSLYSLIPVLTDRVPTLATDRWWRVYINPEFFGQLSEDEGAAVLVHEVWHPLGLDWERSEAKGVTPETSQIWNIARDCEINSKDGLLGRLPKLKVRNATGKEVECSACSPEAFGLPEGLFAEEMYDRLLESHPHLILPRLMICIGHGSEDKDGKGSKQGDPQATPGAGACGSCADGQPKPWELPGPGDCDTPGQSEARTRLIQAETARAVIEASSQSIGTVPAGWLRWAKKVLNPRVRWQDELGPAIRGFLTRQAGGTVPTCRRVGRRTMSNPRLLPRGRLRLRQRVAWIMDTSGSMSDDLLARGCAEIDGVCKALGREVAVTVYFTDACAYEAQRVTSAERLQPIGGGGTDMGEGFQAVAEAALHDPCEAPDLVICATDGYTPWPDKKPVDAKVLCLILTKNGSQPGWCRPPDGRVLRVIENEEVSVSATTPADEDDE